MTSKRIRLFLQKLLQAIVKRQKGWSLVYRLATLGSTSRVFLSVILLSILAVFIRDGVFLVDRLTITIDAKSIYWLTFNAISLLFSQWLVPFWWIRLTTHRRTSAKRPWTVIITDISFDSASNMFLSVSLNATRNKNNNNLTLLNRPSIPYHRPWP